MGCREVAREGEETGEKEGVMFVRDFIRPLNRVFAAVSRARTCLCPMRRSKEECSLL